LGRDFRRGKQKTEKAMNSGFWVRFLTATPPDAQEGAKNRLFLGVDSLGKTGYKILMFLFLSMLSGFQWVLGI